MLRAFNFSGFAGPGQLMHDSSSNSWAVKGLPDSCILVWHLLGFLFQGLRFMQALELLKGLKGFQL